MGGSGGGGVVTSGQWVISSDVVYEPEGYAPLLATLCALASRGLADDGARPRVAPVTDLRGSRLHLCRPSRAVRRATWPRASSRRR